MTQRSGARFEQISRSWCDEWLLDKIVAGALQGLEMDEGAAWWAVTTIKVLISHQGWFEMAGFLSKRAQLPHQILESWLGDSEVQQFLQVNRYRGTLWFNKEVFEQLMWWMLVVAVVTVSADPDRSAAEVTEEITAAYSIVKTLRQAAEESGYQIEALLEIA
jgi:hypothetical protein